MPVLVIAEHAAGALKPATLSTVTAALQLSSEVHVLVAGEGVTTAAHDASRVAGIAKVLCVDGPAMAEGLAENLAAQVVQVASSYSHLVFAATAGGKNVAPRVAALLDVGQVSEVTRVVDPQTYERPTYAGNVMATVRSRDATQVITVRPAAFAPASHTDATASVETVASVAPFPGTRFVGRQVNVNDRPDLTSARVVVSGGRAMASSEQFTQVLAPLADKFGAALGASRAAVDAGYAPNDLQVGQTGKVIAPDLYIACGISGAIQHLAGMKDSKVIVAINKDPEAPIFGIADYGLEADLFEAVPALAAKL